MNLICRTVGLVTVSLVGCHAKSNAPPGPASDALLSNQRWSLRPNLNPYPQPLIDLAASFPGGARPDPDFARVDREIERTESEALAEAKSASSLDYDQKQRLLGRLALYDKSLSVNRNIACITCHMPETGFTSPVSLYNQTIVAFPGSVAVTNAGADRPNHRVGARKPLSYGYAAFSPVLGYRAAYQNFYGGNFWDMRATGRRLGNSAAEQAEGPPADPAEHGFSDSACVVYRLSQAPYRALFEEVWGTRSFAIQWPADVEKVCATPVGTNTPRPFALDLGPVDRQRAGSTYDHFALAIALVEASPEISPFSSKFDAMLAGQARLTPDEQAGFRLFHGKARCNHCHADGFATDLSSGSDARLTASNSPPLFTDWAAHNLGIPRNLNLAYLRENEPDQYGWVVNPAGADFVDHGVGGFLKPVQDRNPTHWSGLASRFDGTFLTPTLRNVDRRPRPDFVKAYGHNGYFKSLKEVVHFYNTSRVFPSCSPGSQDENVTCWPQPEIAANIEIEQVGDLGLTDEEENQLVAFLGTLSDGYSSPKSTPSSPSASSRGY